MLKSWETDEWKEKKAKFLVGKCCEKCSSTKSLIFAHKRPVLPYSAQYKEASQLLLEVVVKKGVYQSLNKYACPICFSFNIKKVTNKYRCLRCFCSFLKPYTYNNPVKVNKKDLFDFQQKYAHLIKKFVDKERQMQFEDYSTFKNIQVLCKTCYSALYGSDKNSKFL